MSAFHSNFRFTFEGMRCSVYRLDQHEFVILAGVHFQIEAAAPELREAIEAHRPK